MQFGVLKHYAIELQEGAMLVVSRHVFLDSYGHHQRGQHPVVPAGTMAGAVGEPPEGKGATGGERMEQRSDQRAVSLVRFSAGSELE